MEYIVSSNELNLPLPYGMKDSNTGDHNFESPKTVLLNDFDSIFGQRANDIRVKEDEIDEIENLMRKSQSVECSRLHRRSMPDDVVNFSRDYNGRDCLPSINKASNIKIKSKKCSIYFQPEDSGMPAIGAFRQLHQFWKISRQLHQFWKISERNRRLSRTLSILKQAQIEVENNSCPEACLSRTNVLKNIGPMGVALFSPLDAAFAYDLQELSRCVVQIDEGMAVQEAEDESLPHLISISESLDNDVSIVLEPESPEVLQESPRILPQTLMQEIADRALPCVLREMTWKRLYSLNRDGDSFQTFLNKVQNQSKTLMVIRTSSGSIFGGFADSSWGPRRSTQQKTFFGTGQSFLFSVKDSFAEGDCSYSNPQEGKNHLNVYKWSGENDYIQICDTNEERIAMGGGGQGFGLCLQENFTRGSTEHCQTFNNDPLEPEGYFDIVEFEVFGFVHSWVF